MPSCRPILAARRDEEPSAACRMDPASLINALTPLAWPLVALAALIVLRQPLVQAFRRLLRLDLEAKGVKIAATLSGRVTDDDMAVVAKGHGAAVTTRRVVVSVMIFDLDCDTDMLSADEASALLNRIQGIVVDAVRDAEGTIDSWDPDCLVAYWNAPVEREDHARRALNCAIEAQSALITLRGNTEFRPLLRSHALVTTFDSSVGVIGAGANRAFRILENVDQKIGSLRAFARAFNLDVAVTGFARDHLDDETGLTHLGKAIVRGKMEPVDVYAVPLPGGADVAEARRHFDELAAESGSDTFPFHILK